MVHRMLLREIVIDVPSERLDQAKAFWARALDTETAPLKDYAEFTALVDPAARCVVGIQDVGDDGPRYHVRSWVVLRDPLGLLLCVVPPDTHDFADRAREVQ